jgi:hypothetical protein
MQYEPAMRQQKTARNYEKNDQVQRSVKTPDVLTIPRVELNREPA